MKRYTCKIIRTEYFKMYSEEHQDILYINPDTFSGMCARRYHIIYCDKHFLDDEKVNYLLKKCLNRWHEKVLSLFNNYC